MITGKIKQAYQKLLEKDSYLLEIDVHERSITHKFAEYLQELFPNYNVDCEYNRTVENPGGSQGSTGKNNTIAVFPDIIVHHRGKRDNYIAIEAKKSTNRNKDEDDIEKLKGYKKPGLNYKNAYFIKFLTGKDSENYSNSKLEELIIEVKNKTKRLPIVQNTKIKGRKGGKRI